MVFDPFTAAMSGGYGFGFPGAYPGFGGYPFGGYPFGGFGGYPGGGFGGYPFGGYPFGGFGGYPGGGFGGYPFGGYPGLEYPYY